MGGGGENGILPCSCPPSPVLHGRAARGSVCVGKGGKRLPRGTGGAEAKGEGGGGGGPVTAAGPL